MGVDKLDKFSCTLNQSISIVVNSMFIMCDVDIFITFRGLRLMINHGFAVDN